MKFKLCMDCSNKKLFSYKFISRLLTCVLFAQVLFPIQIYVHHESGTANHDNEDHVIDYHNKVIGDIEHSTEEYTHSIEITSNFIAKKVMDNAFQFALVFTLVLSGLLSIASHYQRRIKLNPVLYRNYFQLSPPLRAPPY